MPAEIVSICVGPLDVNCYLAGCRDHLSCAVIDPGDSAALILAEIAKRGWSVSQIINTHGHADHTGANGKIKEAFGNAPLSIHRLDAPLLTNREMRDMAAYLGLQPSPPPDILLDDGAELAVCPCAALKVIHTPGHSPGGICLSGGGFLISGDSIFRMSIGRSDQPGGNYSDLINSIKTRIFILPEETIIYPGHGDPTTVEFEKGNNPFVMSAFFR